MTAASAPRRELPIRWIGRAAFALLIGVFLIQLPYFFASGAEQPLAYAFNYGWAFVILLIATAWTRTVPLRVLALAWFVGVYPVAVAMMLIGVPLLETFGYEHAVLPGFLLPLTEELIKPLPILLLYWWASRRAMWQPSATDGMLVGFVIGAGVAFHEDMLFGRTTGAGPAATPLSWIFPTLYHESGEIGAYHDTWLALVGLAIGAAFMLRNRTRLAWVLPFAAWLIVFTEHWTWNYSVDPVAGEPFLSIAMALRALLLDGAMTPVLLIGATAVAIVWELRVLRSVGATVAPVPRSAPPVLQAAAELRGGDVLARLRTLQSSREYERARRSLLYDIWQSRRDQGADTVGDHATVERGHDSADGADRERDLR